MTFFAATEPCAPPSEEAEQCGRTLPSVGAERAHPVLAFLEGIRGGWGLDEVASWCRAALLVPGHLGLDDDEGQTFVISEKGATPRVLSTYQLDPAPRLTRDREADLLLATARERVLGDLRLYVGPGRDDRLVRAAIYSGRVVRSPACRRWTLALREQHSLGEWVLALAAADILNGHGWLEKLDFCCICGAPVAFGEARCPAHLGRLAPARRGPGEAAAEDAWHR